MKKKIIAELEEIKESNYLLGVTHEDLLVKPIEKLIPYARNKEFRENHPSYKPFIDYELQQRWTEIIERFDDREKEREKLRSIFYQFLPELVIVKIADYSYH